MPKETCTTCQPVVCCAGDNLFAYNLQRYPTLQNVETGVIVPCPPGFTCDPNVYPLPVTIPPGTVSLIIPFPITDPNPPPLVLNCPAGGTLQATIPAGSTPAQIMAIAAALVAQCVQAVATAKGRPAKRQPYNSNGACVEPCAATANFKVNGALPQGFFVGGNSFCVQAGIFTSFVSQADADAQAVSGVQSVFNGLLASGVIQCGWFNAALSLDCPGTAQIVNVPAGMFFSDQATGGSQMAADSLALAYAMSQCIPPGCTHPNPISGLGAWFNQFSGAAMNGDASLFWLTSSSGPFNTFVDIPASDITYTVTVTINYTLIIFNDSNGAAPGQESHIHLFVAGTEVANDALIQVLNNDMCESKTGQIVYSFSRPNSGGTIRVQIRADGIGLAPGQGYPYPPAAPFPCVDSTATVTIRPLCPGP